MKRRFLLLTTLLVTSGCSVLHPIDTIEQSGRFSLRVDHDGKNSNLSGRWRLIENARITELTLMTPLYGILARITITDGGATLERPNKSGNNAFDSAPSAEELMLRHLGFSFPANMLSAWLSGHPWKQLPSQRTSEGFLQSGWSVSVKRTKENGTPALVVISQSPSSSQAGITVYLTIE